MKFEISGIVTASMQPDVSPVTTKRMPTPPALRGIVLSSQTGYPVARVKVAAVGSTLGSTATVPLGEAVTGVDGRFEIHFLSLPKARQALVVIDNSDEMHLAVKLATTEGKALHSTVREQQFRLGATITVLATLPTRTLGREDWLALGRRLVEARIVQVHQLA